MNIDNRIAQTFAPVFFVVVTSAASLCVGAGLWGESAPTATGAAPAPNLPAATYAAFKLDHSVIDADARRADDAQTVEASIAAYER
jgi:hypothetical protein